MQMLACWLHLVREDSHSTRLSAELGTFSTPLVLGGKTVSYISYRVYRPHMLALSTVPGGSEKATYQVCVARIHTTHTCLMPLYS